MLGSELQDSVALITGASKGIGLATARLLASEGCHLVLTARSPGPLRAAAAQIANDSGRRALAVAGDASRKEDIDSAVEQALRAFGRLDVLVACAGSSPPGDLEQLSAADWRASLEVKFLGYLWACRAVLPEMRRRKRGSIVLVVGTSTFRPSASELTAGAANAAVNNVARALAEEYGGHGVRINTVHPGPIDTDRWAAIEASLATRNGVTSAQMRERVERSISLGRIGRPDEVASAVTFLASERASFVNGAALLVDGGQRRGLADV